MRNEREIIEKILDAARQDDSVRVVIRTDLVPKRKYLYIQTLHRNMKSDACALSRSIREKE